MECTHRAWILCTWIHFLLMSVFLVIEQAIIEDQRASLSCISSTYGWSLGMHLIYCIVAILFSIRLWMTATLQRIVIIHKFLVGGLFWFTFVGLFIFRLYYWPFTNREPHHPCNHGSDIAIVSAFGIACQVVTASSVLLYLNWYILYENLQAQTLQAMILRSQSSSSAAGVDVKV